MSWGVAGLGVEIAGTPALVDVDLDIDEGRIAAVVGGDGAGKTTLARVLTRLLRPDRGRVTLPTHVGYQPASSGTWSDLTVLENLRFVADAHRIPATQLSSRLEELLEATGLGDAVDRLAGRLSGGMRQKLGVAMALVARPTVLVLDEPTTGVDPVSRSDLWRLVSGSAAHGAAVVMTTTYLDEAERASTVLALDAGRVIAIGPPQSIGTALEGAIWRAPSQPEEPTRWRRGADWRVWTANGAPPERGGTAIAPDMTDVLTAATLSLEGSTR